MSGALPPDFFLYGEAPRSADPDFIHVEDLAERSAPGGWQIAAHRHADLSHLILITKGAGRVIFDGEAHQFQAPQLLVVPARTIHQFSWQAGSTGTVLTVSEPQLHHLLASHAEFAPLFESARLVPLPSPHEREISAGLSVMERELNWITLGREPALHGALLLILVHALRSLQQHQHGLGLLRSPDHLVARYRQLLEQRYRLREPIGVYARALGVSETALREACAACGQSPGAMRDQRSVLEAQRLLAFSALSVGQIAEAIGFADPAYFSRFFSRNCGASPARWRSQLRQRRPLAE